MRGDLGGLVVRRGNVIYLSRGDGLWSRYQMVALAMQVQELEF